MRKILGELNRVAGVKGCLVLTEDGFIVEALVGDELDPDAVSAVASHMILTAKRVLGNIGFEPFQRFVLTSTYGKMVFVNLDAAFLVTVTSPNIKLDVILIEINSTAHKIKNRRAPR